MNMSTKLSLLSALAIAACNGPTPSSSTGALSASSDAKSYGVYSYTVNADSVTLLGKDGASLGVLRVTEPTETSRLVEITDGTHRYHNMVTAPAPGAFEAPLELDGREAAVQLDPALAPVFAAHDLAFSVPPAVAPTGLTTEAVASCSSFSWASGCAQCSESGAWPCSVTNYGTWSRAYAYAVCPAVNCSNTLQIPGSSVYVPAGDVVSKRQTCYQSSQTCSAGGTDTNGFMALGWTGGCSDFGTPCEY